MKHFKAIAAMSENRVIGNGNKIPWHLPEDFKWFKKMTTGQIVVMGSKTFESIGKPLPNRETIVLSRSGFQFPGVRTVSSIEEIERAVDVATGGTHLNFHEHAGSSSPREERMGRGLRREDFSIEGSSILSASSPRPSPPSDGGEGEKTSNPVFCSSEIKRDLEASALDVAGREIFICGGAQIYQQTLRLCSDLYLTLVKRTVEGDAFFPPFEEDFVLAETIQDCAEFKILHYVRRAT